MKKLIVSLFALAFVCVAQIPFTDVEVQVYQDGGEFTLWYTGEAGFLSTVYFNGAIGEQVGGSVQGTVSFGPKHDPGNIGPWDWMISFPVSPPSGRFDLGNDATFEGYWLKGIGHIQNLGPEPYDSKWINIPTPEPQQYGVLAALGLLGLYTMRRIR